MYCIYETFQCHFKAVFVSCYINPMTSSFFFFTRNINDDMESVKQMQRSALLHSLLRHTELFMKFCCQCVFAFLIIFYLIQFNTFFISYKNLFFSLSFGELCSCDTHRDLLGIIVQPALFQLWRKSTDSHFRPPASNSDKAETGLKGEQPAKNVVNCSVRGEAVIKQRWQRAVELRRLFTWKPTTMLFFFFLQAAAVNKQKNGGKKERELSSAWIMTLARGCRQ